jgi:antitoxin HigA-1
MGERKCERSGDSGLSLNLNKMSAVKKLRNIHPGEILQEEFLLLLQISAYRLSKDTGIPQTRISEIVKGNRRITADTALRFSRYFGTSAKFWLGLQDDYDLEAEEADKEDELKNIKHHTSEVG